MTETTGNEKNEPTADPVDVECREDAPSPEEQMARYEEALKDEDWGHQPC